MPRLTVLDLLRARALLASGIVVRRPLLARGDYCTRCLQPGHTASSCPRPWVSVERKEGLRT